MIVVFDTNIWISALFFGGLLARAVSQAFARGQVAISRGIVKEIEEVAVRKFAQRLIEVEAELNDLLARCFWVEVLGHLRVSRDPNDDFVPECALNAKAQVVVTDDRDLRDFEGIRIMTGSEFLQLMPSTPRHFG